MTEQRRSVRGLLAPRGRRLLLPAATALVVVAGLVAFVVRPGADDEPSPRAGAGATATSAPAEASGTGAPIPPPAPPQPAAVTGNVDELPPALAAVPLEAQAAVGDGVVATLPRIESIEGSAVGPGNIAGPALRVTVRIENGTGQPVPLDGVAVNLAYGPDDTPGSPLGDASEQRFRGTVGPGESAEGVYVFSVPADARDRVTVEVGYRPGAPRMLFTGSVG